MYHLLPGSGASSTTGSNVHGTPGAALQLYQYAVQNQLQSQFLSQASVPWQEKESVEEGEKMTVDWKRRNRRKGRGSRQNVARRGPRIEQPGLDL